MLPLIGEVQSGLVMRDENNCTYLLMIGIIFVRIYIVSKN